MKSSKLVQVRGWGQLGDDRAGGGGQHGGGGARDQGAGGLQQLPLHLPPRHRRQDCTGHSHPASESFYSTENVLTQSTLFEFLST